MRQKQSTRRSNATQNNRSRGSDNRGAELCAWRCAVSARVEAVGGLSSPVNSTQAALYRAAYGTHFLKSGGGGSAVLLTVTEASAEADRT